MRKKPKLARHKADMSCGETKTQEKKPKTFSTLAQRQIQRKVTLLPNLLLATQVYSRPSALITSLEREHRI